MIKKIIAWPTVWITYWLGHLVSKIMPRFNWGYPVYQRLMSISVDIDDWADLNFWQVPDDKK